MTEKPKKPEKPFSPALISALRAVARMRGDSTVAWGKMVVNRTTAQMAECEWSAENEKPN